MPRGTRSSSRTSEKPLARKKKSPSPAKSKSKPSTTETVDSPVQKIQKTLLPSSVSAGDDHPVIDSAQLLRAAKALLKHVNKEATRDKKKQLFDYEDSVLLTITLHKVPMKRRLKPYPIEDCEICVFVKDPASEVKGKLSSQAGVSNVKKVMGIQKLRDDFGQFEARRKLLNSYDIFLCDDRVSLLLPRLLGKPFIKSKRVPVPIRVGKSNLAQQVARARDSTYLFIPSGTQVTVRIGLTSQTPAQIVDNVMRAIGPITSHFDQRWASVRSLSIRTSDSIALPFYSVLPPVPRPKQPKKNQ